MRRLTAAVVVLLAVAAPAAADPIPSGPTGAAPFTGAPAVVQPVPAPAVPRHPFMADNERSNLHNDAYQTDAYRRSGPVGRSTTTSSGEFAGVCGSVTFDRRGRIITVCVSVRDVTLRLLDPVTLESLAEMALPPRSTPAGSNPFQNFTGGGYFYLDHEDRAVIPTSTRHVLVVGHTDGKGFEIARDVDLSAVVPSGDGIISVLPDWEGRLWFASRNGVIGTVGLDGKVKAKASGEPIGNSFAVGEDGVYIVTDVAMYQFEAAADGTPTALWREVYPNDGVRKLGQSQAGSGTTPTLMGPDLVAITDNADPINVIAYRRARRVDGPRELCRVPVFEKGASSNDQSLLTDGRALIVENNYGYEGPQAVGGGQTTKPGLSRVDVDRKAGRCTVSWTSKETAPSVVPKLALGSGLVYTYTKPGGDSSDPWFFTALDHRTGKTIFSVLAGAGPLFNNNYAPVTVGPDGAAYVGVLGGLVAFRDAMPPGVAPAPDLEIDPAPRPPRVSVVCGRRGTIVVRTTDARVRELAVRRGNRTVRDRRRPLRVRVRRGARLTISLRLTGGARTTVTVPRKRCA